MQGRVNHQVLYLAYILGKPSKRKIKSVDFFHTGAGGGQPQIHTFLKVWIFRGWGGVLGPISTLFKICALEFCPISSNIE